MVGFCVSPAVLTDPPPAGTDCERPPPEIEQAAPGSDTDQVTRDDVPYATVAGDADTRTVGGEPPLPVPPDVGAHTGPADCVQASPFDAEPTKAVTLMHCPAESTFVA